jgi:glycosyltransferase involved in cell wall biosynthesis
MKICQLCAVDFTLHHFLMPLMRAQRAAGHEVVGACARGALTPAIEAEGFRVIDIPIERSTNPAALLRAFFALHSLFRSERFDVVHVHTPIAALAGRPAARLAGVGRVAYTAHGFYFHEKMPAARRAFYIALEWFGGRFTDVLLTQAEEDAAAARRFGLCKGGVIEAIGNGSDPTRFRPAMPGEDTRKRLRGELGAAADRPVFVMIGRLVAEKGYPELFRAMKFARAAELWVVGERLTSDHAGSIDADIQTVKSDPDLSRRIKFLGYRADIPEILRSADAFVLPSHREGMPRSIIEAMLTGLPVVATDIRGSREEVIDGETGLLVPLFDETALGEALNKIANDAPLRAKMGAAGLARARALYDENKVIACQMRILGIPTE